MVRGVSGVVGVSIVAGCLINNPAFKLAETSATGATGDGDASASTLTPTDTGSASAGTATASAGASTASSDPGTGEAASTDAGTGTGTSTGGETGSDSDTGFECATCIVNACGEIPPGCDGACVDYTSCAMYFAARAMCIVSKCSPNCGPSTPCYDAALACYEQPACGSIGQECIAGVCEVVCPGEPASCEACEDDCAESYPEGSAPWHALDACYEQTCAP